MSLGSIARAVGITEQGVLHYFPTKVHLLLAILERAEQDAAETWRRCAAEGLTALEALMELARERPDRATLQSLLMAESVNPDHPAHQWFAARNTRVRGQLAAALAAAQREGAMRDDVDPGIVADQIQGIIVGVSIAQAHGASRADQVLEAFLRTLTPDRPLRSLADVRAQRTRAV